MTHFPRILIGSPTSSSKSYCDFAWIDNVLLTNYPNFQVRLFDNSLDNGEYADRLNNYYKNKYGNDEKFACIRTDTKGLEDSLIARICASHNDLREYAIWENYEYLYHLESDVFCQPHFLQELILANKQIIGALYYRDFGSFRKLMVQQRVHRSPNNVFMYNFDSQDDLEFVDGTVKQAGHIGLGAVLIRLDVLKKIPFRFVVGVPLHSDSHFSEDVFKAGIKVFAHTELICEHRNSDWGQVYNKNNKA